MLDKPEELMMYEYDAGVDKSRPGAVVFAQNAGQVAQIMKLASQHKILSADGLIRARQQHQPPQGVFNQAEHDLQEHYHGLIVPRRSARANHSSVRQVRRLPEFLRTTAVRMVFAGDVAPTNG